MRVKRVFKFLFICTYSDRMNGVNWYWGTGNRPKRAKWIGNTFSREGKKPLFVRWRLLNAIVVVGGNVLRIILINTREYHASPNRIAWREDEKSPCGVRRHIAAHVTDASISLLRALNWYRVYDDAVGKKSRLNNWCTQRHVDFPF